MQACSELPETGVADRTTWQTLLGKDFAPVAPPADVSLGSAAIVRLLSVHFKVGWRLDTGSPACNRGHAGRCTPEGAAGCMKARCHCQADCQCLLLLCAGGGPC